MNIFVNNRVGTYLKETEVAKPLLKDGELLIADFCRAHS